MHKGHGGGGFTVLRILGAAVLAFLLPPSADDAKAISWHAHAHPVAGHGAPAPHAHAAGLPPPTAGADDLPPPVPVPVPVPVSSPHFGFPLQPGDASSAAAPGTGGGDGEGYPFIGSNPVLPLPDTGDDATGAAVVGFAASVRAPVSMIGLGVFLATLFLYKITGGGRAREHDETDETVCNPVLHGDCDIVTCARECQEA